MQSLNQTNEETQMKRYDNYEADEYYWEDNDNQDGTYFREYEKPYEEEYTFGSDRDPEHEEKKRRAALYIRAHFKELMKDESYRIAYYKLIDESARELSYMVDNKPLIKVTEKERDFEGSVLDLQISIEGKRKVERYKSDAIYIVDWVRSGKSLMVYI